LNFKSLRAVERFFSDDPAMGEAILLNYFFEPILTISWQRAVVLVWTKKAEMLKTSGFIKTVHGDLPRPRIVRMLSKTRSKHFRVKFNKNNVLKRDRFTCQYCGKKLPKDELSLDHVKPRWAGGQLCFENIVTACRVCNQLKGDEFLERTGMRLLQKPFVPSLRQVFPEWVLQELKEYLKI